jgi:hypothetical protein
MAEIYLGQNSHLIPSESGCVCLIPDAGSYFPHASAMMHWLLQDYNNT